MRDLLVVPPPGGTRVHSTRVPPPDPRSEIDGACHLVRPATSARPKAAVQKRAAMGGGDGSTSRSAMAGSLGSFSRDQSDGGALWRVCSPNPFLSPPPPPRARGRAPPPPAPGPPWAGRPPPAQPPRAPLRAPTPAKPRGT